MAKKHSPKKIPVGDHPPDLELLAREDVKEQFTRTVTVSRRRVNTDGDTVGSGITARSSSSTSPQGPGIVESVFDPSGTVRNSFDTRVFGIEEAAGWVLERAGLTANLPSGKDWRQVAEERGFRPHEDKEWYAAEILHLASVVRQAIEQGRTADAAAEALALGALGEEAYMKFQWEKSAIIGARRREVASASGKKRGEQITVERATEHARWQAEAVKIRAEKPDAKKPTIARIVKKRLKLTEEIGTIRKII